MSAGRWAIGKIAWLAAVALDEEHVVVAGAIGDHEQRMRLQCRVAESPMCAASSSKTLPRALREMALPSRCTASSKSARARVTRSLRDLGSLAFRAILASTLPRDS